MMENKQYKGSCHCGSISFSFEREEPITEGLKCNCSICIRKGAPMSAFTLAPEELEVKAEKGALGLYQFDSKVAKHFFCNKCGVYTFHQTVRKPGHSRVNLGCIDEIDTDALEMDLFDGKSLL